MPLFLLGKHDVIGTNELGSDDPLFQRASHGVFINTNIIIIIIIIIIIMVNHIEDTEDHCGCQCNRSCECAGGDS